MRIPLDGGKEEPAREAESPGSAFPSGVFQQSLLNSERRRFGEIC